MVNSNGKEKLLESKQHKAFFLNLMFKLFFKYLDEFIVFWRDDFIIYSQTKEEHLKHLKLVFEKFREAGSKFKMSKCEIFKAE